MKETTWIALTIVGIVFVLAVIIGVGWYFGTHNMLANNDIAVEKSLGDLHSQYQRRADLIPNLVTVVSNSAKFEKSTFTEIAEMRSQAATGQQMMKEAKTAEEIQAASNVIDNTLSRLMVVVEAYPQLKTTDAFMNLMTDIEGTENRIQYARSEYNEKVESYRRGVRNLPSSIIAGMEGYDANKWKMFESKPGADIAPTVAALEI